jgi:hypothetical protein
MHQKARHAAVLDDDMRVGDRRGAGLCPDHLVERAA